MANCTQCQKQESDDIVLRPHGADGALTCGECAFGGAVQMEEASVERAIEPVVEVVAAEIVPDVEVVKAPAVTMYVPKPARADSGKRKGKKR